MTSEDRRASGIKVYRRRWLMLGLFILYSTSINGQWVEYSIISNIVERYYQVSSFAVDCTAMAFMFYYVILIWPATYLTERVGVRWTLILGGCLTCAGAWIKTLASGPDRFAIVLVGQSIVATTQVLLLPMPGRIAAKWFGSAEQSIATSIGVFGSQLGTSMSFLLPPMLVKDRARTEDIGRDLSSLSLSIAVASSFSLLLLVLLFEEEPKLPPSATRALQQAEEEGQQVASLAGPISRLMNNRSFLVLCNSYGLGIGVLNALTALLNPLFLKHFAGETEHAGRIGLLIVVTGTLGSVVFGVVLDKTHKFKETTVTVYFLILCGQIFFAVALFLEVMWMVYVAAIFLGFFMSGYIALGYEMAVEYTYPEAESLSAGLLNVVNNVYGVVLVLVLSPAMLRWGDVWAHVGLCLALLLGFVMSLLTKDEQRRQDARKAADKYQAVPLDRVKAAAAAAAAAAGSDC